MSLLENVLRALRLGPLVLGRNGRWFVTVSFPRCADPYSDDLVDCLVKQGAARVKWVRSGGRGRRIVGGTAQIRAAGLVLLRQLEGGFEIDIGQSKIWQEVENAGG